MPISKRNKQFIIVGIIIAIIAVGAYLGYIQYGQVVEAQQDMKKANDQLGSEQQELQNLKELSESLQQMSIEMNSVRQALPNGIAVPELLTNLEAIAVNSEVTFNSISIATEETIVRNITEEEAAATPSGVKSLPVSVSVTGDYLNIKKYIDDLERNMRLLDVESIDISGEGIVDINMTAYYVE
ncbi:type 4a pilus biogenesis protein PilO [Patescibacteria group bacterium]